MGNLWSSRRLLWELVRRELRGRVVGSVGGWVWLLARPLLAALAYFFVFDLVFQVRLGVETAGPGFGVFLLAGLLPWMAFTEGVSAGTTSLLESANLLRKTALPVELFPARAVLAVALLYAPVVWLYGLALMASRGGLDWALLLPLWILLQLAMTYCLALCLALLAAALRDVVQLVGLVTTVWMFLSPVLFPLERVPAGLATLLWLNPGTPLVLGYHALILDGRLPQPSVWFGALGWTLLPGLLAALLLRRVREQVVDWL